MTATETQFPPAYRTLCQRLREAQTLESVAQLAGWDQETYMPRAAAPARAEQMATLARLVHERMSSPEVGELLDTCESTAELTGEDSREAANLREIRRDYDLATKLPVDLVEDLARTCSQAQEAWKQARGDDDYTQFQPWLEKIVTLARRKAECYGAPADGEPYDALLNVYEPDARSKELDTLFAALRTRLTDLIQTIVDNGTPPDPAPTEVRVPEPRQHALGLRVVAALGFDLDAGRLDLTTHPFCSGVAPGDTRLTTRYRDERFTDALYGTMHECGHGLYEQGLPKTDALFGQPLAVSASLGVHESQSRLWENFVGRSGPFWQWLHPIANDAFAGALEPWTSEQIVRAVNTARPSFIRVEADEATYNLHVMLRFTIERELIAGDLRVADVPARWNQLFKTMFDLDVPDDRSGCLQDVHWSCGLIGYFPTYALGNLYAAQLWEALNGAIPDLDDQMARGDFAALLAWLREHVHAHGRRYRPRTLCHRATGKELSADPLMRHLERRLKPVYGV